MTRRSKAGVGSLVKGVRMSKGTKSAGGPGLGGSPVKLGG